MPVSGPTKIDPTPKKNPPKRGDPIPMILSIAIFSGYVYWRAKQR